MLLGCLTSGLQDGWHVLRLRIRLAGLVHFEDRDDGDHKSHGDLHDEVERLLIAAERTRINDLFRSGKLKDEARRRIERELDLREAHLSSQRRQV